jgi:hypothetical protein
VTPLVFGWIVALFAGAPPAGTVTVVAPLAVDDAAAPLAAELGLAIDGTLRRAGLIRHNDAPLLPGEVSLAFGCAGWSPDCAASAASAAGATWALWAVVTPGEVGDWRVEIALVDTENRAAAHRTTRRLRGLMGDGGDEAVLAPVAAWLAGGLLDGAGGSAVILSTGSDLHVDGAPGRAATILAVSPGVHRMRWSAAGEPRAVVVEVAPGELVVVRATDGRYDDSEAGADRRLAAWITLGVSAATGLAALATGVEMGSVQDEFDSETDGDRLRSLADRGDALAAATNGLVATSVLAAGVSIYLFSADW